MSMKTTKQEYNLPDNFLREVVPTSSSLWRGKKMKPSNKTRQIYSCLQNPDIAHQSIPT